MTLLPEGAEGVRVYEKSRRAAVLEDGRRMAWCLSALFIGFFFFNAIDFQPPVRNAMLAFDAVLIGLFALFGALARPDRFGRVPTDALGAALGLLTGANILTAARWVGMDVLYTAYLGLTIIGVATVMLSFRWFAGTAGALFAAWAVWIGRYAPRENLPDDAFILIAATTVALVLLSNRARGFARLQRMRVYSSALLGQRTAQGVALTFGRFTALLTDSTQWSVQWTGAAAGAVWVDGRGALSQTAGLEKAVDLPTAAAALAAGRPFAWNPARGRPADPDGIGARAVLAVPLVAKGGVRAVLWLARRGHRNYGVALRDVAETCATQARSALESVGLLDEVKALAITDELTGLFNRRQFMFLALREHARRPGANGNGLAVVMGDIDFFKKINDAHGHGVGDVVLKEVAQRLRAGLRAADVVGRYGGEEFSILLSETNPEAARVIMERLRRAVADTPVEAGAASISVTMSFGLASRTTAGESFDELMALADKALYRAKAGGRNRVEFHTPS